MSAGANIQLALLNRPESVAVVRDALRGLADALALEQSSLDDVTTAVSEACNNVVLHAYEGGEGPLEVDVFAGAGTVTVTVRDEGGGIMPSPMPEHAMHGVGLAVIQALTQRVEFRGARDRGTDVLMEFHVDEMAQDPIDPPAEGELPPMPRPDGGSSHLRIAPFALAGPVLSRLVGTYAARARFSLDRLSDAQLLADALAAHAPSHAAADYLEAKLDGASRKLSLTLEPFRPGATERLIADSAVGGLAPVIEELTDSRAIERANGSERLVLQISDSR